MSSTFEFHELKDVANEVRFKDARKSLEFRTQMEKLENAILISNKNNFDAAIKEIKAMTRNYTNGFHLKAFTEKLEQLLSKVNKKGYIFSKILVSSRLPVQKQKEAKEEQQSEPNRNLKHFLNVFPKRETNVDEVSGRKQSSKSESALMDSQETLQSEIAFLKEDITHFGDSVEPTIEKMSKEQPKIVKDIRDIRRQLIEKKKEIAKETANREVDKNKRIAKLQEHIDSLLKEAVGSDLKDDNGLVSGTEKTRSKMPQDDRLKNYSVSESTGYVGVGGISKPISTLKESLDDHSVNSKDNESDVRRWETAMQLDEPSGNSLTITDMCAVCASKGISERATHICKDCSHHGRYYCQLCFAFHEIFLPTHKTLSLSESCK